MLIILLSGELHFDGYNGKQRKEIENDKRLLAKKSASMASQRPVALIEPILDDGPSMPLKRQRLDDPSDVSNITVDELDGGDESVRDEVLPN